MKRGRIGPKFEIGLSKLETFLLSLLCYFFQISNIMPDVFLLSFSQELRSLGANNKLLHFIFLLSVSFLLVFQIHLVYSILHWDIIVGVIACRYILGYLIAEFKVGDLEVYFGDIFLGTGALFVLECDVRGGLLSVSFVVHFGLLADVKVGLSGILDHFFALGSFFNHLTTISYTFVN